jgi:hypothetical protein
MLSIIATMMFPFGDRATQQEMEKRVGEERHNAVGESTLTKGSVRLTVSTSP